MSDDQQSTPGIRSKAINSQTRILIVDDSPQFSMILKRLLTGVFGYNSITTFPTSQDALERIAANPDEFGLIFLDFHFPQGMNGAELLAALAERQLLSGKIVFLMSSDPTAEALQQVLKAGAAGVITKPFDREELKRQLDRAVRLAAGDEESFSF
jgi:CheY-like chemotaxis protein